MKVIWTKTVALAGLTIPCVFATGCLHRDKLPALSPQAKTPNIYVPPPDETQLPPMEAQPPAPVIDAKPVVAEEAKPPKKRSRRNSSGSVPVAPAPVPAAVLPPPPPPTDGGVSDAAKLGELASGGQTGPKQHQDVAEKITAVEKRLSVLSSAVQEREQKQIAKVRLFSKEASDALKSGDVDGARILATKADLLLDDLTTK